MRFMRFLCLVARLNMRPGCRTFSPQDEILIKKLAKYHGEKQEVTVDIKPLIESLELISPCVWQLWCVSLPKPQNRTGMMQAFWQHCGHPEAIRSQELLLRIFLHRRAYAAV